ncbi:hypothetical protein C8J57DRAFT_1255975 [Mycena rebaudengoi]|nr:hypothetical protein C8J57DRAFT_1255975 [Mycena rebaudengoi]
MGRAIFTPAQLALLEPYLEEYYLMPGTGKAKALSEWKNATTATLAESDLFSLGGTWAEWTSRIAKKFDNSRTNPSTKLKALNATAPTTTMPEAQVSKEAIKVAAGAMAKADGVKLIARYQPCKKKMWDAVEDAEKEGYNVRAAATERDVGLNQSLFPHAMWCLMQDVCAGGAYGTMQMMTLYAFRDPNGKLVTGVLEGNGGIKMDLPAALQAAEESWALYAKDTLPAPASTMQEFKIPHNAHGVPVLPTLALGNMTPTAVAKVLGKYLLELWIHSGHLEKHLPWDAIRNAPGSYYDTAIFLLPAVLQDPEQLDAAAVLTLAQYFKDRSLNETAPFVFLSGETDGVDTAKDGEDGEKGGEGSKKVAGKNTESQPINKGSAPPANKTLIKKPKAATKAGKAKSAKRPREEEDDVANKRAKNTPDVPADTGAKKATKTMPAAGTGEPIAGGRPKRAIWAPKLFNMAEAPKPAAEKRVKRRNRGWMLVDEDGNDMEA